MLANTPWGVRRVARYLDTRCKWFIDIDALEGPSRHVPKRFRVFYGPSVCKAYATRKEAFAFVRGLLRDTVIVASPYVPRV